MSRSFWVLLGLFILAGSGPVLSQGPMPGGPPIKRYPWDERQPKCFFSGAPPVPQCRSNDWPNYHEAKNRVERLLIDADLDLVLKAEKDLGASQTKFATGQYYFETWYDALEGILMSPNSKLYPLVEGWGKAEGKNGYATIARALLSYGEAWKARGNGGASTVTREAWNIYDRKLKEANQTLESAPDQVKRLGAWYALKLRIAYQLPEEKSSRGRLLSAGTDLYPDYMPLYGIPMYMSLPKWGGTYQQVDQIAHVAYERTKARSGAAAYATSYRLIFAISCDCTIADSAVDWNLMKQGFRDIEKQGAGDAVIWATYANFACQMRDRAEARRLIGLADAAGVDRRVGPPDACREFAFKAT
jgi:hypothetical protein